MRTKSLLIATLLMLQSPAFAEVNALSHQPTKQPSTRDRLSALEKMTYGSSHDDQPILGRLEALESEILGSKHANEDLPSRLERLETAYGTKKQPASTPVSTPTPNGHQSPPTGTQPAGVAQSPKADVADVLANAVAAYDKRQIAKAKDLFEKVLDIDPGNADANFSLGEIAEDRDDLVHAQKYYQRAHDTNPNDAEIASALKSLQKKIEVQDQPEKAIKDDVAKATADFRAGNYGAAKKSLEHILSINPRNDRAHFALGECLRHLGDQKGALAHIKEAVRLKPDDKYYKQGLDRLTAVHGNDFVGHDPSRRVGEIIPIDGSGGTAPRRIDSVSWDARNLIAQSQNIIDSFLATSQSGDLSSVQQFTSSLNNIRRMSPDPAAESVDDGPTYHARGAREAKQGLLGDALADYRKAFSQNPWDAGETLDLVSVEMESKDWASAEQHCMAAIGCKPTLVDGWFNLGLILANNHDYQKSMACFSIADMQSGDTGVSSKLLETARSKCQDATIRDLLQKALDRSQTALRLSAIGIKFLPNPELPDPSMLAYRANLLLQLADKWQAQTQHCDAVVVATINKDGKIVDSELVRSSGTKAFDDQALETVRSINPAPLPAWFLAQQRQLILNFDKVNRLSQAAASR